MEEISLEIVSHPASLSKMRQVLRAQLRKGGFSSEDTFRATLAVDEACTNIIRHCYHHDHSQKIKIRIQLLKEAIRIVVSDYGPRIEMSQLRGRHLDKVRPGGLGMHFISKFMDEVKLAHPRKVGNDLILTKYKRRR